MLAVFRAGDKLTALLRAPSLEHRDWDRGHAGRTEGLPAMGGFGRRERDGSLPMDLPLLQNLIKRDPQSYREEFQQQMQHFRAWSQHF